MFPIERLGTFFIGYFQDLAIYDIFTICNGIFLLIFKVIKSIILYKLVQDIDLLFELV